MRYLFVLLCVPIFAAVGCACDYVQTVRFVVQPQAYYAPQAFVAPQQAYCAPQAYVPPPTFVAPSAYVPPQVQYYTAPAPIMTYAPSFQVRERTVFRQKSAPVIVEKQRVFFRQQPARFLDVNPAGISQRGLFNRIVVR